jgi:pilus assembly protein Flp/PilA
MERIKNFFKDESGAAAVEYGLLIGLIAVAVVAVLTTLGPKVAATFQSAQDAMP